MHNDTKRVKGAVQEAGGKIEGGVGKLIGNDRMQAKGKVNELEGQAKQAAAKSAERAKGKVEQVAGAVKNRIGKALDNERLETEGRAEELRGDDRRDSNR